MESSQQYVRASSDPPGCTGFVPNTFKKQLCGNCSFQAIHHKSATDDQIRLAIQLSASDTPTLIVPGLYVGGYKAAMTLATLQKARITHVVNTAKDIRGFFPTFREFPDTFTYLHLELEDSVEEDLGGRLEEAVTFISTAVKGGGRVFLHCMQGKSRSGSVAIAYLMVSLGLRYDEALEKARTQRPLIEPNLSFERQLREFEKSGLLVSLRDLSFSCPKKPHFPSTFPSNSCLWVEEIEESDCLFLHEILKSKKKKKKKN